ncbi:MAG TPA: alpha/beta fold hydrolase [Candidatus Polarisedimenticolia bacterium]|nr:alpha/beta fold hydrolase [Candidatus Polarisedimenticolia bacterium]
MLGRFLRSGFGIFLLTLVVLVLGAGSMVGYQIYSVTHPPRVKDPVAPGDLLLRADAVSFQSTDGVTLSAWLVHGDRDAPVIILCHDLGESKAVFLDAAIPLQQLGYNILMLDFRGHGNSSGNGSTLGTEERYDVMGAIDFLRTRRDLSAERIGLWGIGMGAYAGLFAAAERKEVSALALDSLYPDVEGYLDRLLFKGLPPATSRVTGYASVFYAPYFQWKISRGTVSHTLPQLSDRNFLFVVATSRPGSVEAGKELYASLQEGGQSDKNLLELQGSGLSSLYDADRRKYSESIATFFGTYLRVHPDKVPDAIQVQVR